MSEYVRDLIRADERQKAREKLEALLMEGIESGTASTMTRRELGRHPAGGPETVRSSQIAEILVARIFKREAAKCDLVAQWVWYAENADMETADRFLAAADSALTMLSH